MSKAVYADYAAITPIDDRVILAMNEASRQYGNPSSRHSYGRTSRKLLDKSRQTVAQFLSCSDAEVTFTASGTESNNLAVLGIARANKARGNHIVTSSIEHPSVINACRALERDGFKVTYLPVNSNGVVDPAKLQEALTDETILVSIHLANSEIGVVQDIPALSEIIRTHSSARFHTDACQAAAYTDLNVQKLGVDSLTFNGTKLYGPRGIAALYVKEGTDIFPLVYGGGQEKSLRSGTENIPAIVGLSAALEIVVENRDSEGRRIEKLRDTLEDQLSRQSGISINANQGRRLPNYLSITLVNCRESDVVRAMDERGVAVSSGSACSSKSLTDSHVLKAIGLTNEQMNRTLRITLGRGTVESDIEKIVLTVAGNQSIKKPHLTMRQARIRLVGVRSLPNRWRRRRAAT
jgi:cysteine desulfurase